MDKRQCPKCGMQIKNKADYYRHVKRCGNQEHRVQCRFYPCTFSRNDLCGRHMRKKHPEQVNKLFSCSTYQKTFRHEENLMSHQRLCGKASPKKFKCPHPGCEKMFTRKAMMEQHRDHDHQTGRGLKRKAENEEMGKKYLKGEVPELPETVTVKLLRPDKEVTLAKESKMDSFFYPQTNSQQKDLQVFFKESLEQLEARLETAVQMKEGVKWNLILRVKMELHSSHHKQPIEFSPYFHTDPYTSTQAGDLRKQIQVAYERLEDRVDQFTQMGSGWTLRQVHELQLQMAEYQPLYGSSYLELHSYFKNKKAIINVKNEDDKCFMWAILAALHPVSTHPERVGHYLQFKEELNFEGINFPVTISNISKFEKLNPSISISVIGYEDVELFPIRLMKEKKQHHITLLYWSNGAKSHYAWVKSLSRLLRDQTKHKEKKFFCERGFHGFIREDLLQKHLEYCQDVPMQRTVKVDEKIQFTNHQNTEPTLFRVYADFECVLKKVEERRGDHTERVQKHIPCGFAWTLISKHPDFSNGVEYFSKELEEEVGEEEEERGKGVIGRFMEGLQDLEEELVPFLIDVKPMELTGKEWQDYRNVESFYMCSKPFTQDDYKVLDHDHATGEYRGAAHRSCNLQKKRKIVIPIFIHNLRDYDAHLIMRGIHEYAEDKKINVIPNNLERYVSFSLGSLRFLDSFQFMPSSLSQLATNLEDYPHLKELFSQVWEVQGDLQLLTRKGVYPYDYSDSFQKFQKTQLPPKEAFYSDLTGEDCSDKDYDHAQ